MSRVYFHTEHERVELLGTERAHMGSLVTDLAVGLVPWQSDRLEPHLTPDSPLRHWLDGDKVQVLPRWISTYLSVGDEPSFRDQDGQPLESLSLALNTALVVGSDPVCLLARLHAQCEIHCYVEGPNRGWMAGVIDQGQESGVMRGGAGWPEVATLLRSADDGPVVCSFTVTESFPNPTVADWSPPSSGDDEDDDFDAWYDLPRSEQWSLGIAGLRSTPSSHLLELRPDTLCAPFGHGRSLIDVFHGPPRTPNPVTIDGPSEAYPQATPKDRALAYLRAMEAGQELTTHQSMDIQAGLGTEAEERQ